MADTIVTNQKSGVVRIFDVPRVWEYTRTETEEDTIFSFGHSEEHPGYVLQIANKCLRRMNVDAVPATDLDEVLFQNIDDQLQALLGSRFKEENAKILNGFQSDLTSILTRNSPSPTKGFMRGMTHLNRSEDLVAEINQLKADACKRLLVASIAKMSSREFFWLAIPLVTAISEERAPFTMEDARWPYESPPVHLRACSTLGFTADTRRCLLAPSFSGADLWVVRWFAPRGVSHGEYSRKGQFLQENGHLIYSELVRQQNARLEAIEDKLCKIYLAIPPLVDHATRTEEEAVAIAIDFKRRARLTDKESEYYDAWVSNGCRNDLACLDLKFSEATGSNRMRQLRIKLRAAGLESMLKKNEPKRFRRTRDGEIYAPKRAED